MPSCTQSRKKHSWWIAFDAEQADLRALVAKYHPASGTGRQEMPVNAERSEAACEQIRNEIAKEARVPPLVRFDAAVKARDATALVRVLNEAWFGMPESNNVRFERGFNTLCDLCEGVDKGEDEKQAN